MVKWKTVLWLEELQLEILDAMIREGRVYLMVWGCISSYGTSNLHNWKGTINAERYIQVLEEHMLPCRQLFQGRPCIF